MLLSDSSSNSYGVYIGKARSFSTRVLDHLREKPNWHTALVFNSSVPGFLTDTEINYLEHLGIKLAKELYPELTENLNVPAKPAISPEKEDEMVISLRISGYLQVSTDAQFSNIRLTRKQFNRTMKFL